MHAGDGAPLRALLLLILLWSGGRMLWESGWAGEEQPPPAAAPATVAAVAPAAPPVEQDRGGSVVTAALPHELDQATAQEAVGSPSWVSETAIDDKPPMLSTQTVGGYSESGARGRDRSAPALSDKTGVVPPSSGVPASRARIARSVPAMPDGETASPFSAYAYVFWRPDGDGARDATALGQLGGSQAGLNLRYRLAGSSERWLAASIRVNSAIDPVADERLAVGLRGKPLRNVPVHMAVERRFGLSEGLADDSAAYVYGGIDPVPVVPGVDVEAFAQAGVVIDDSAGATPFADAQLVASAPVASIGAADIRIGAGSWSGVQDDDWRIDAGPRVEASLPVAEGRMRLSVDWRQRIGGNTQPDSGVAVTLSAGF